MGLFDGLFSGLRDDGTGSGDPDTAAPPMATDDAASASSSAQLGGGDISALSPTAASVVQRCAQIAGVPVEQLVRRLEPDEQPPLAYARSIVEYCSYVALRAETRRRHDHLGDREFHSLTYDMMLAWEAPDHDTDAELQKTAFAWGGDGDDDDDDGGSIFYSSPTKTAIQVDGRRTVGPEAFAKIAPACPAVAHPITVRNLFDALTNSTGGRLHFLIYHKYLKSLDDVLRSTKCISGGHKAPALDLCDGEVVLDIFGAATTQPVLQHIGTSTWPGRLTLTNHALYFEAIGVDFSYGDAVVYDLTKDLKQCVKRESTGPWGAHLFDKAVMYKSSSINEPVFFEFPQFKGHSRRDYWFAVIKEVLHAHKFIRRYRLTGFKKAEALAVATLGILRYRAVKEGFHILPAYFKTTLAFNLAEKLPKGDKILEALYGQLQEHCSRFRGGDDLAAQGSSDELALADPFPLSAFTLVRMGLLTLREEDNPEERDFAVGDVQIGRTSSVQMALERSVGYSGRVEAARATLDQVKVEDIDTNVAVLKELVFPLIEIGKRLVFLAEWEDPLKSYVFLLCFLYIVYRGLIWYIFPGFLVGSTAFMLWNKHHGNRHFIEAFEVTTPPRRRTVEQLLALQEAISQLEAHVQAGNIFLLKLRSLMLAAFPQSTNKVATTMLVAAAAFAFMPFRIIFVLILLEAYTRHMPLRKKSSEKLVRRLREWWLRIPAAPVQLLRPHDTRRWRSRRR
ncbi:hypothetical protein CFC21_020448 [Triticum aestivum]|uniref:Uncharacterized protein n=3 Tax=Triticum TaxID=4564 RepID=A0A9R1P8W2_TRITD|nr:uncharacterized protein LOC123191039 [Triticum aestivum]XP_044459731.1 uncharacterized protein LOC123191039 [Triticum aestivum]KAF7005323.1 hypothetical protein CFC21_020448 [Triticum aestivum]VAH38885.1 unnamed protein product [Triticum turgidum subsp. durum]